MNNFYEKKKSFLACNCHDHSDQCVYDEEISKNYLSLDINGNYLGGGRCLHCKHNTAGINCNKCKSGFYRLSGKLWNDPDVCEGIIYLKFLYKIIYRMSL